MKAAVPAPKKEGVRRKGEDNKGDANNKMEKGLIWVKVNLMTKFKY